MTGKWLQPLQTLQSGAHAPCCEPANKTAGDFNTSQMSCEADVGALNAGQTATFKLPTFNPERKRAAIVALAPGDCIKHTVKEGEMTYDIANLYSVKPANILLHSDNKAAFDNPRELAWPLPGAS